MPRAISRPAPPEMKIAGSSSAPCAATKLQSWSAIPACHVAAPITPISMPLVTIMQIVPIPAVMPIANVAKHTAKLLVMMPEAASGLIVTMDFVHISRFSIVSIIFGPRIGAQRPDHESVTAQVGNSRHGENEKSQKRLTESFAEDLRKRLRVETDEPADFLLVAHVDEVVRASKKLIQVKRQLVAGHIFAHGCEVRCRLAVQ